MKRLGSAVVAVFVLVAIMLCPPVVIAICAAILSIMCLWETLSVFSYQKIPFFTAMAFLASAVMPFMDKLDSKFISPLVCFFAFMAAFSYIIYNKRITVTDSISVFFFVIIIPFCFSHVIYLRNIEFGEFYIWLPFIGAFLTDTFAYFTGSLIGGRKLCENLSPKKTVSGSIGGFIGAVFGFFVYSLILKYVFSVNINLPVYYLIAVLCGGLAQVGDLTASAIKRAANTKDFGNIMPGHGGMMDRVDSLMFVAPLIYFVVAVLEIGVFF